MALSEPESTNDPEIHCPECGETYRDGDAWESKLGTVVNCQHCDAELECTDVDMQRSWTWSAHQPKPRTA